MSLILYSKKLQLHQVTIEQALEGAILIDVEALCSFERSSKIQMVNNGKVASAFRREMRFDPYQLPNRMRALTLIKHTMDTRYSMVKAIKSEVLLREQQTLDSQSKDS